MVNVEKCDEKGSEAVKTLCLDATKERSMTPQILYLPPPSMETSLLSWSWPSVRLPSTGLVAPSYLQFQT